MSERIRNFVYRAINPAKSRYPSASTRASTASLLPILTFLQSLMSPIVGVVNGAEDKNGWLVAHDLGAIKRESD
jgi:hypothetical protein